MCLKMPFWLKDCKYHKVYVTTSFYCSRVQVNIVIIIYIYIYTLNFFNYLSSYIICIGKICFFYV